MQPVKKKISKRLLNIARRKLKQLFVVRNSKQDGVIFNSFFAVRKFLLSFSIPSPYSLQMRKLEYELVIEFVVCQNARIGSLSGAAAKPLFEYKSQGFASGVLFSFPISAIS